MNMTILHRWLNSDEKKRSDRSSSQRKLNVNYIRWSMLLLSLVTLLLLMAGCSPHLNASKGQGLMKLEKPVLLPDRPVMKPVHLSPTLTGATRKP